MNSIQDAISFFNKTQYSQELLFRCTNSEQSITLRPGVYSIECWGASGKQFSYPDLFQPCGNGSYTFGLIRFDSPRKLFLYVGNTGGGKGSGHAFGGGGIGDFGGGGASDVRLIGGDSFDSLKSRIMVAAGGGGADSLEGGGSGGAFQGLNSQQGFSKGASQTSPGTGFYNGTFGIGGGEYTKEDSNSGGGGGYYGGGSGKTFGNYGGSGGSSYVSGLVGCNSISNNSTQYPLIHTGRSGHYSGITFFDSLMIDGDNQIITPDQTIRNGNFGSGFIRIRLITQAFINYYSCNNKRTNKTFFVFLMTFLSFDK